GGGVLRGPVYFFYGPKSLLSSTLMKIAVNSFQTAIDGGVAADDLHQVAYVDGLNRFNPYYISKVAVSKHLSPQYVLKNIIVARTFTWNQMVESLEEKLADLEDRPIKLLLVSGLTSMFEEMTNDGMTLGKINYKVFQDLKRIFAGINRMALHSRPIIVLTGPLHSKSDHRPAGGHLLSHFCGVIAGVHDNLRFIDYTLDQHPYLPYTKKRLWKPKELNTRSHRNWRSTIKHSEEKQDFRSLTLDQFLNDIIAN
ncbi:MAG: hypothetical protein ACTSWL_04045, partial [Promethearchaeota archaeon]